LLLAQIFANKIRTIQLEYWVFINCVMMVGMFTSLFRQMYETENVLVINSNGTYTRTGITEGG